MKTLPIFAFLMTLVPCVLHASQLAGFYQTIDDETNKPKAIVVLYEYTDGDDTELAGRIVATYDTDGALNTQSKYTGQDIIWDMEWDNKDNRYEDGKIRDPKTDKVYSSVIWQGDDKTKLNVRGKIGPFGRTQVWNVLSGDYIPAAVQNIDTKNWTPQIRK